MEKNKEISQVGVLLEMKSELNLLNKILNEFLKVQKQRLQLEAAQVQNAQGMMGNLSEMFKGED